MSTKLCTVLSELFRREVNNLHVLPDKRDSEKTYIIEASISLDKKLKDQSEVLHPPFSLFYTIKSPNGKVKVFQRLFSASIYTELEKFPL